MNEREIYTLVYSNLATIKSDAVEGEGLVQRTGLSKLNVRKPLLCSQHTNKRLSVRTLGCVHY